MKRVVGVLSIFLILVASTFGATKITVWAMGEEAKSLDQLAKLFMEEYPEYEVNIQAIPWANAYDKILTGIAGRQVPDVAQMGTTWMAPFGSMGAFEDLTPYIQKSEIVKPENFFEGAWQTGTVSGKQLGIPWYVDTRALYYRTDLLAEVGYDHAPQNWDELYDAAKKLAEKGKYGITLYQPQDNYQVLMPFVWQNGGDIIDSNGKVIVDQPEFVEAFEYYTRFFTEKLAPIGGGGNLFQDFASGNTPMFFSGPWMVTMIRDQVPQIEGKWNVALMPQKKTRTSFMGGSDLVIFRDSKNKEGAWKFIEFLSRPDIQVKWYQIVSALPSVQAAWDDPILQQDPMIAIFGEQLNDAKAPVNIPQFQEISVSMDRRVEEAIYARKTAEQAAKDLKKDIEKILK
ncbi:sugar ABC transporter substrate-binding protein [Petrotoga sp. 9PWA.NaAc.5.4]|uniref:sugar ABC transporter substrate-binding protein n=1 Tax=Petrotoga sp. 9PWA.NaAc.5.4 TaxID=1434328 RepID=UPI001304DA12|nr:sugar ABC transporter substrate-binding protein [Petrotoga sp. 9PWA.NaAc.5.4]